MALCLQARLLYADLHEVEGVEFHSGVCVCVRTHVCALTCDPECVLCLNASVGSGVVTQKLFLNCVLRLSLACMLLLWFCFLIMEA